MTIARAMPGAPSFRRTDAPERLCDLHVVELGWPEDEPRRAGIVASGTPCIWLVADGVPPPGTWSEIEDWVRHPVDPDVFAARAEALRRRALRRMPAILDEDGLLHRGKAWVALSPSEIPRLRLLLDNEGRLVPRNRLQQVARVALDEDRALDSAMQRLRRRVAPLGVDICTVRAGGFVLELTDPAALVERGLSPA